MVRYLTAGESHGVGYTIIIDGFPAGLKVDFNFLNSFLKKRQLSKGRSARSSWEKNQFHVLAGLHDGATTGAPLSFFIENDQKSQKIPITEEKKTSPRPGHADLAGVQKFNHTDVSLVWERSSGRETVARTLCGALCLQLLKEFQIQSSHKITFIGGALDAARKEGTSVGGIFEVRMTGLPVGLGSYTQWDQKIDATIAQSFLSIQGVKGVEFGLGFKYAQTPGHQAHDEILESGKRKTNNAGGIEGGMTNGEDLIVRAVVKPPATLLKPLSSIDIKSHKPTKALVTRSDVCFVPACAIVGEAVLGFDVTNFFLKKFGGDSITEIKRHYATRLT